MIVTRERILLQEGDDIISKDNNSENVHTVPSHKDLISSTVEKFNSHASILAIISHHIYEKMFIFIHILPKDTAQCILLDTSKSTKTTFRQTY